MLKKMMVCVGVSSSLMGHAQTALQSTRTIQVPTTAIVIAHRGASAWRPEHTLASYEKAIEDGADFIEPDLVSTQDGVLIARHENEIGGTSNVSNLPQFANRKKQKIIDGQKIEGWFTEDFTLQEIKQLKARERIPKIRPHNTQYNDQYDIPTLEQIIQLAEKHYKKTGKVVGLYIETKHPSYFQQQHLAMEDRLLQLLAKYDYTRKIAPIYLQSFEVSNLKYMQKKLAVYGIQHAYIIQLYDQPNTKPADYVISGQPTTYADMATLQGLKEVANYANGVGPSKDYIIAMNTQQPTHFIQDAHAVGLKVHPYTFRPENNFLPEVMQCGTDLIQRCEDGSLAEITMFLKAGVDGFFTDDPKIGRKAVENFK